MSASGKRRRKPTASLARARAKKAPPAAWYGLAAVAVLALLLLLLTVVVVGSYLAPVFGKGWPWFGATLLLSVGVPAAIGLWLVRPLEGFKRAAWFTGVIFIVPALAVVGLSAGVPRHTARQLRLHGHLPFEQLFGPKTQSGTTRLGLRLAATWAGLLHGQKARSKTTKGTRTAQRKRPRARPRKPPRKLFYSGVLRPLRRPPPPAEARGPVSRVRFALRGQEIMVSARILRKGRKRKLAMMLDTGASVCTLDRLGARKLKLKLPETPVTVELQTAAGPRTFPVAVLDRLRLGRAELKHVTVAICDPCAQPGIHGLIGLNFTRHFVTTIDHKKRHLTLRRQTGPLNRISDVEPFLRLSGVQGAVEGKTLTITGKVHNRGPRTVTGLGLEAVLLDPKDRVLARRAATVDRIHPANTGVFKVTGPGHKQLVKYRIEFTRARW